MVSESPKRGNFARNAARFSLAAPTFWLVISCLASRPISELPGDMWQTGWWLSVIVGVITLGIVLAGLALGIVAALAGKRENNQETLGMGAVGALLNACVLVFFAFVVWWVMQPQG